MPEGPEVRKYADAVDAVLTGRPIISLTARTRDAREWLAANSPRLSGHQVMSVRSHGKHLVGLIEGGFYFHSHLMMWGRWQTYVPDAPTDIDRRERARIIVGGGAAILYSAPIFNVGEGNPAEHIEHFSLLGPDALPYPSNNRRNPAQRSSSRGNIKRVGKFNATEFRRRLGAHPDTTIGAALLNQRIVAGLGNYLRAEVLFTCRINPWTRVEQLKKRELACLSRTIPELALRSYLSSATAPGEDRERMRNDPLLVYKGRQQDWEPGRDYGTRYLVFRRTNLPCLRCGNPIKQRRQTTMSNEPSPTDIEEERSRIIYFCPHCQNVET
jgi:formamidopyrimidine-DNA glycosylase